MKFFVLLVTFLMSYNVYSYVDIRAEERQNGFESACKVANVEFNKLADNEPLFKAYYLDRVLYCISHNKIVINKEMTRDEWFASHEFNSYKKQLNDLISKADAMASKEFDENEVVYSLANNYYVLAENSELLKKKYIKNTVAVPPENDEHPFLPDVFIRGEYKNIAMRYLNDGMYSDAQRVLNELEALPGQFEGKVDEVRIDLRRSFGDWQSKIDIKDNPPSSDHNTKFNRDALNKKNSVLDKSLSQPINVTGNSEFASQDNEHDVIEQNDDNKLFFILLMLLALIVVIFIFLRHKLK